ncbi:extracellular solute-binding protein [Candidatus Gracilibacteria bacterium]|nr:extracellular solute-binding protein [Candidatus Gracilibacteria bacterium]
MTTNAMTRRRFLQAMVATGGASFLAACGSAASPPATGGAPAADTGSAGGSVTLDILNENWGEIYNNLMTVIGDEFTKENPDIALAWNFDPDWSTKLATLTAAGTPPDATVMRAAPLTTFAAKNSLTDLTPLLAETGLTRDDFITPLFDGGIFDGKLYAIPGGADYIALYYNKDVYRAVGLDPEQPPTTFAELIEHSKAILQKTRAVTSSALGTIQQLVSSPTGPISLAGRYTMRTIVRSPPTTRPMSKR